MIERHTILRLIQEAHNEAFSSFRAAIDNPLQSQETSLLLAEQTWNGWTWTGSTEDSRRSGESDRPEPIHERPDSIDFSELDIGQRQQEDAGYSDSGYVSNAPGSASPPNYPIMERVRSNDTMASNIRENSKPLSPVFATNDSNNLGPGAEKLQGRHELAQADDVCDALFFAGGFSPLHAENVDLFSFDSGPVWDFMGDAG